MTDSAHSRTSADEQITTVIDHETQWVVLCANGEWCAHAAGPANAMQLCRLFDREKPECGPHDPEMWTRTAADEASRANRERFLGSEGVR